MISLAHPYSHSEISAALSAEFTAVHDYFAAIAPKKFFAAPVNVWTPADNLDHLIRSCSPVAFGLKAPKTALRLRFGKPKHQSRTLPKVRSDYVDGALASGGQASGPYLPKYSSKNKLLKKWSNLAQPFQAGLARWSDAQLDQYQAVHPLLGAMTVRELLFFTLYHNMHHVNDVQRLLDQPEVDWFGV